MKKPTLTSEHAKLYVKQGIHETGGWTEGWCGLRHKTIPAVTGGWSSVTVASILALTTRALIVLGAGLFPLIVRRVVLATPNAPNAPIPSTLQDGLKIIANALSNSTMIDFILGGIAIFIVATPKLLDMWGREAKVEHHSPYRDLSAAIRKLPLKQQLIVGDTLDAIRLTLLALREEMSLLIGDGSGQNVADVTLLEFCDSKGKQMTVRARTANHEDVRRPIDSDKFMAYYVALEGRNFAEHDFKNSRNPFPPKRLTVLGKPDVNYRSVLYMPIICSEQMALSTAAPSDGISQIVDSCVGVICVHSAKAYRFWRWGDHNKGTGGFADVAFSRSMPYIALIEQLLSRTAQKVKLEVL